MQRASSSSVLIFVLVAFCLMSAVSLGGAFAKYSPKERIRLETVTALTLRRSKWTAARRGTAIEQLRCVGKYCHEVDVEVVQCQNAGASGPGDVQWRCTANLPAGYSFGEIDVNCEGYDSPDDEFVLQGSCGLTYALKFSGGSSHPQAPPAHEPASVRTTTTIINDSDDSGYFWTLLWLVVIVLILVAICQPRGGAAGPTYVSSPPVGGMPGAPAYAPVYGGYAPAPSSSSWWSGYATGRMTAAPRTTYVHTHTTTTPAPSSSSSWSSSSAQAPSSESRPSTGFGGTSRR